MPHLQERGDDKAGSKPSLSRSFSSGSELPITEAKEGFLQATEGLLTIRSMNMTSTTPTDSYAPARTVSDDASATPQSHYAKQSVVTPSPFSSGGHQGGRAGPIVTIFGTKKLVPSPIRAKRLGENTTEGDDEESGDTTHMSHPTNLRYNDSYSTPTKPLLSHTVSEGFETDDAPKKRLLNQLEKDAGPAAKKTRVANVEYLDEEDLTTSNDETRESAHVESSSRNKKPIISPTSSTEKIEDDEAARSMKRTVAPPPYGHDFHAQPYTHHRYPYPPVYVQPPYGAYPMYGAYPPPPPHPCYMGRPAAPHFYPAYPPHHPAMMHRFHSAPPAQPFRGSPHPAMPTERAVPSPEVPRSSPPPSNSEIKSVQEWRKAALTTGKPPSANRCVPLKEPIPSKYWGNAEKTMDAILPDFHRLVNFPDYLVKSRNSGSVDTNVTPDGKKNCVMCGKLRVCSASTYVNRGKGVGKGAPVVSSTSSLTDDDNGSAHIIPRQNKGLCTACDVTVWVVVPDGLEIKWCKGCKNFRPWAAFGDKGSATKCVRCRDRQREKYAMQKDEIRQRKVKRSSSGSPSEESLSKEDEDEEIEVEEESSHMAAAQGLQTLINAATI